MLAIIKHLRINQKLILITCIFVLFAMIAFTGLYEIAKTSDFQRLERDHLECLDVLEKRIELMEALRREGKSLQKGDDILDKRAAMPQEMGITQLVQEMKSILVAAHEMTNSVERLIFGLIGFGEVFELTDKGYEWDSQAERIIGRFRRHDITFDQMVTQLASVIALMREGENKFSKLMNSASHIFYWTMISLVIIAFFLILILGWYIYKEIMTPLNEARSNIHASSQELQANSKRQLEAVSSQTSAMAEIGSVMQELVATSRKVSEISLKAASLGKDTSSAVDEGHTSLNQALEGINKIKEKVEISASNMLSLGEKSQRIGIVLDVINELSQKVTVLSYNATIEAAGAGETGKRFMAVADRIIKLAERSVESAKEVKSIIDDIQTDSNKTIMSSEDGIKAVEEGIAYSMEVKQSLDRTNEVTRELLSSVDEIAMSLDQQKTGVELAASEVEDITLLVRETGDSSKEALETVDQLLKMAEMLERM